MGYILTQSALRETRSNAAILVQRLSGRAGRDDALVAELRHQKQLAPIRTRVTFHRRGSDPVPSEIHYGRVAGAFGECLLAWTSYGICWLSFGPIRQTLAELQKSWVPARLSRDDAAATEWGARVFAVAGDEPVHLRGTAFQLSVWSVLLQIRPGHYLSYAEVAHAIGHPRSARAVGQAVGANPIALLVPCHRVLAAGGRMGGFRWGTFLKRAMLEREVATAQDDFT